MKVFRTVTAVLKNGDLAKRERTLWTNWDYNGFANEHMGVRRTDNGLIDLEYRAAIHEGEPPADCTTVRLTDDELREIIKSAQAAGFKLEKGPDHYRIDTRISEKRAAAPEERTASSPLDQVYEPVAMPMAKG